MGRTSGHQEERLSSSGANHVPCNVAIESGVLSGHSIALQQQPKRSVEENVLRVQFFVESLAR